MNDRCSAWYFKCWIFSVRQEILSRLLVDGIFSETAATEHYQQRDTDVWKLLSHYLYCCLVVTKVFDITSRGTS